MAWVAVGVAGASLLGGLLGQDAASKDAKKARQAQAQALAQFSGLEIPEIADQQVLYDQLVSAGQMTPELEQALALGPSALEGVSTDPRLKSQQMRALEQLGQISETGMSAADQAAFELARRNAAQENQAMQGQILQQMQARGQGGSGAELIARLTGAQKSADSLQAAQLEQAKAQQAARMQALSQVGNMSTQIQDQDFNQASRIAEAKDLINKYNAQNSQNVANQNVAAKNAATLANLQNQQRIMDANAGIRNSQQDRNKSLIQQDFNNRASKVSGLAGQYQASANAANQQAANTAAMYNQAGQAVGTAIGSYFNNKKPLTVDAAGGTTQMSKDYLNDPNR